MQKFKNTSPVSVLFEREEEDDDSSKEPLNGSSVEQTTGLNMPDFSKDEFFTTFGKGSGFCKFRDTPHGKVALFS